MANGYQQFFKKAQELKREDNGQTARGQGPTRVKSQKTADAEQEQRLRSAVRMKAPKRAKFPWKALAGLGATFALVTVYLAYPDLFSELAERIEISAIGGASASEAKSAEKSSEAKPKSEKAAAAKEKANPDHGPEAKAAVSEDLSHFEKLKQRKEELDTREKELSELEEELQRQKAELDKRIQQLETMRTEIAQVLKDRVDMDQEKVTKLVDLYSSMKPKQAADVIGNINEDLAVEVLAKMKKKNAAEIMNLLPPEKARTLSEKYTGYRRNLTDSKG